MAKLKGVFGIGKVSPEKLEAQNKLLEIQIDALFQEQCDITKITDALGIIDYQAIKERGESLSKQTADIQLSFKLNQYQAIIAFRAGKDSSQYLKACAAPVDSRNEFMITLEKKIAELGKGEETVRNNINKNLYKPLLQVVQQKVENLIKAKKYDKAIAQTNGLINDTTVPAVIELYVDCVIKKFDSSNDPKLLAKTAKAGDTSKVLAEALNDKEALVKALNLCKSKFEKTETKMLTIYQTFQSLQAAFDRAKDSPHAAEAAKLALRYNPEPSTEDKKRLEIEKEIQQKEKELADIITKKNIHEAQITAKKKAEEIDAESVLKKMQVVEKANTDLVAKNAMLMQQLTALTSANQASSSAELTSANQASNSTPSAPPPYSTAVVAGSLYPNISKERAEMLVTSPLSTSTKAQASSELKSEEPTTTINDIAQQALTEITKIINSDKPNTDRVAALWKKAIAQQDNLYDIIDDSVMLLSLASSYLSLQKSTEAKKAVDKAVDKAITNDKDAYDETKDPNVLNLIAEEYNEQGLLKQSIEACKKAALQPGFTPCVNNYSFLKEIGERKKSTDKDLAIEAFKAAKDQTTDASQRIELSMTIIQMYVSANKLTEAKQEYLDLNNQVPYQKIFTFANNHKLIESLLLKVDDDLITYKSLLKVYQGKPDLHHASDFHKVLYQNSKCEIKVACTMEANCVAHNPSVETVLRDTIRDNPNNEIIARLTKCYDKYYSKTTSSSPEVLYLEAIGAIDDALFGHE